MSNTTTDTAALLAGAQHAVLGVKEDQSTYKPTTHPDAQWFGSAGLGLFLHWGISTVHGEVDISWGMIANLTWGNAKPITPAEYWKLAERFNPENDDRRGIRHDRNPGRARPRAADRRMAPSFNGLRLDLGILSRGD
jgi:hypothetical protein